MAMAVDNTLHLFGFEPFRVFKRASENPEDILPNPSQRLVQYLISHWRKQLLQATGMSHVRGHTLPVPQTGDFAKDFQIFQAAALKGLEAVRPGGKIWAFGQGDFKQMPLRIETAFGGRFLPKGVNLEVASAPWVMDPERRQRLEEAVRTAGLGDEIEISGNAGAYLCDAFGRDAHLHLGDHQDGAVHFAHLPFLMERDEQAERFFAVNVEAFAKNGITSLDQLSASSTVNTGRIFLKYLEIEKAVDA